MYYVNFVRIKERSAFTGLLVQSAQQLQHEWKAAHLPSVLAQERILHLAIECITDIGSDLIDGFMMRDASSYEDIIDILFDEAVVEPALAAKLTELVRLRKLLMQDYTEVERTQLHPYIGWLPEILPQFTAQVQQFLSQQPLAFQR